MIAHWTNQLSSYSLKNSLFNTVWTGAALTPGDLLNYTGRIRARWASYPNFPVCFSVLETQGRFSCNIFSLYVPIYKKTSCVLLYYVYFRGSAPSWY